MQFLEFVICLLIVLETGKTVGHRHFKEIHRKRPNIVFLLADDLDIELVNSSGPGYLGTVNFFVIPTQGQCIKRKICMRVTTSAIVIGCYVSMVGSGEIHCSEISVTHCRSPNVMKKTLRRVRDEGAEMKRAYATSPMCCPSRSSLLTGRYVHNHKVRSNDANCSSIQWRRDEESGAFGVYLRDSGYRTGYFGKYLNQYDGSYIPPGWHEWLGQLKNAKYYNYTINKNGKLIQHGDDYGKDYFTDLIANESVSFLRNSLRHPRKPFFLFVSFTAPHGPEDAAPQYNHRYFNVKTHHTPAYNHVPNFDKQWILQVTPKMGLLQEYFTDILFTRRLQTLPSVDDAVERIYRTLRDIGELENTYLIFTSDHGYHSGQFGLVTGKGFPFETDIRVPLYIRGPGIKPRSTIDEIILNIDMAPTFLDIARIKIPTRMDGRSFKELLTSTGKHHHRTKSSWPDTFLIESPVNPSLTNIVEMVLKDMVNKTKLDIECLKPEMACFVQKRENWKTEPFWRAEPFCACTNSANNTYECIRTINATSNFYYCEFDDGPTIFYDLRKDPWQLSNRVSFLTSGEESYLKNQLQMLRNCRGTRNCTVTDRWK